MATPSVHSQQFHSQTTRRGATVSEMETWPSQLGGTSGIWEAWLTAGQRPRKRKSNKPNINPVSLELPPSPAPPPVGQLPTLHCTQHMAPEGEPTQKRSNVWGPSGAGSSRQRSLQMHTSGAAVVDGLDARMPLPTSGSHLPFLSVARPRSVCSALDEEAVKGLNA